MRFFKTLVQWVLNIIFFMAFIASGVLTYQMLTAEKPKAHAREESSVLDRPVVEVEVVEPKPYPIQLPTVGRIEALQSGDISALTTGRVISIAPEFVVGKVVEAGAPLVQLEADEYRSAVTQAKAQLDNAVANLQQVEAQAAVAVADLQRVGKSPAANPLAAKKPQVDSAKASVASARASLAIAQQRLEKTIIRAPFSGEVTKTNIVVGQQVGAGMAVGGLYSAHQKRILAQISTRELDILNELNATEQPIFTAIQYQANNQQYILRLPITQVVELLDSGSQLVTVYIDVPAEISPLSILRITDGEAQENLSAPEAFGIKLIESSPLPTLAVGELVDMYFSLEEPKSVLSLPLSAVGQNNRIRTLDNFEARALASRTVEPLWWGEEHVIIQSGIEAGEVVVTTPISPSVLDGTLVRFADDPIPEAETDTTTTSDDSATKPAQHGAISVTSSDAT